MNAPRTYHLIMHTHWDREWYLPRAGFQARLIPAIRQLLASLQDVGDARFLLDGQTVIVEDSLAIHPEWRGRLAAAVHAGRLEVGPWYVLADEQIPTGESLVRNLLEGGRQSAALGGRMDVLYSPDAFGHPAALPTLAAEFGLRGAVIWRGLAPAGTDEDLYWWVDATGARVLLHHLPRAGYEFGNDLAMAGAALPALWATARQALLGRNRTGHLALFVGADHHAPLAAPDALQAALQALEPNATVRISTLGEYFTAVAGSGAALPEVSGELRASYGHTWTLQGVHGTRARLKRRHAATELQLLRKTEPLVALARRSGEHQAGLLRSTMRTLLESQFHDTLCGCCADSVAREQDVRLTTVWSAAEELRTGAINTLTHHDPDRARVISNPAGPALVLWNPAARIRRHVVAARVHGFLNDVLVGPPGDRAPRIGPGFTAGALRTTDGELLPFQVLSRRDALHRTDAPRHYPDQDRVDEALVAFAPPPIAGLGGTILTLCDDEVAQPASQMETSVDRLANALVEVLIGDDGRVNLVDRRSGEQYHDLFALIDEVDAGDSYTPWITATRDVHRHRVVRTIVAEGPFVSGLALQYVGVVPGSPDIEVQIDFQLRYDSATLHVTMRVDNCAEDHRIRLRLPVGVDSAAIAGTAFGHTTREGSAASRPVDPDESFIATCPAHRYVAVAQGDRGLVACCTGFFEYEWTARELVLTLLRGTGELSRNTLATRRGHAGWPTAIPEAQETGQHLMRCAVAPIDASLSARPDEMDAVWEDAFLPIDPVFIERFTGNVAALDDCGISLHGSGLVLSAVKAAEAGGAIVVRCYNAQDAAVDGAWIAQRSLVRASRLRADETVLGPLTVESGNVVRFVAPPRAIVTVGLHFGS